MALVRGLASGVEFETDDLSARSLVAEGAAEWVGEPPADEQPEEPAEPVQEQPAEPEQPADEQPAAKK